MDGSPPGSFVHGILQARILEWVAISFSGDRTQVCYASCIDRQVIYHKHQLGSPCVYIYIYRKISAFELCWRRFLRLSWTARKSNQWILKETNPEYSLEGLISETEDPTCHIYIYICIYIYIYIYIYTHHIYTYICRHRFWITLLYTSNYHSTVNQPYLNFKKIRSIFA